VGINRFVLIVSLAAALLSAAANAKEPTIDVMTLNLEHRDRPRELKAAADHMRAHLPRLPDFVMCQEVMFNRGGELDNVAAVFARELGYHCRGTKRKSDSEGLAIISRYPFAFYDQLHHKAQTTRVLLGFNRVSIMAEFMVPSVGRVRVVDVHYTNWGFEAHVRRRQIAETVKWIAQRQVKQPAAVTFLGGDFNAKRNWSEMKQLDERHGDGSIVFADYNTDVPSQGLLGPPDQRIDYIFVSAGSGLAFEAEWMVFANNFRLSDHIGVMHSYRVNNPATLARLPQD
jgi:endonuclease/exonuclease/phosphatase family metal-dependent hydrolase